MNKIMTVKFEKDIGISDEEKNKLRYTLVLHFMEQLKQKGMYKVEEEKHDGKWVISASLVMPTIEAETVNGWISVEDRLPDNVEEVLIYCPEFCEEIKQATWCGEDFFVEREDLIVEPAPNGYCTHWMPLPKPPKGE